VLQLCARITRNPAVAQRFLAEDALVPLLHLPADSLFVGYDSLSHAILRHLVEEPAMLQQAMEVEIRSALSAQSGMSRGRLSPRAVLTTLAPVVARNPQVFLEALQATCKLEEVAGWPHIVLREHPKEAKDGHATKQENTGEPASTTPSSTPASKPKTQKRVPTSFVTVIERLMEIVVSCPTAVTPSASASPALSAMDIDPAISPQASSKGKEKVC
jgi:E3 ubiquitin-protein ligase HUWE1